MMQGIREAHGDSPRPAHDLEPGAGTAEGEAGTSRQAGELAPRASGVARLDATYARNSPDTFIEQVRSLTHRAPWHAPSGLVDRAVHSSEFRAQNNLWPPARKEVCAEQRRQVKALRLEALERKLMLLKAAGQLVGALQCICAAWLATSSPSSKLFAPALGLYLGVSMLAFSTLVQPRHHPKLSIHYARLAAPLAKLHAPDAGDAVGK